MNAQRAKLRVVYCPGSKLNTPGERFLLELRLCKWYNKVTLIERKLVWFGEVVMKPAFLGC